MIATERLYLTADKSAVVRDGDPAAAFLLACEGGVIAKEYEHLVPADEPPADEPPAKKTSKRK